MSGAQDFVHRYFDALMESQYWPRERIVAEQRKYLEQLIAHARKHVPFYRSRLDMLFTPHGEIDWDRWHDVPIVTRKEALEQNEAMLSTALPEHQGPTRVEFTSGSTGAPLRVVQSTRSNLVLTASLYRTQYWHRLDWSRDMVVWFGEDPEKGRLPDGDIGPAWGPPWETGAKGRRIQLNRFQSTSEILDFVARMKPGYFSARPMAAHAAALEAMQFGRDIALDAVLTFSTGVNATEREDVQKAFGARMTSPYTAKEGQFMAFQCPTGTHFHINDESVLVEIVDAEGRPVAPGEQGRVVVTPLYNYAQPLIRYEQGDLAVSGGLCACGRTLGVIESIAGRISQMFHLPDGRHVAMSMSEDVKRNFGARIWQIAQIAPMTIEVRYVPMEDREGDRDIVAEIIRRKTHPDMQIEFSRREDLHRPDGRKFIDYVYEIDEPAAQSTNRHSEPVHS
jgi:phenylacetate-CoA ligase